MEYTWDFMLLFNLLKSVSAGTIIFLAPSWLLVALLCSNLAAMSWQIQKKSSMRTPSFFPHSLVVSSFSRWTVWHAASSVVLVQQGTRLCCPGELSLSSQVLKAGWPASVLPAQRKTKKMRSLPRKCACGVCIVYFRQEQQKLACSHKSHNTYLLTRLATI